MHEPRPHAWPHQLPPPHDPELPLEVGTWIREVLPSEAWRVDALRGRPWELTAMGMFVIDRMIENLRQSHRETVRHFAGLLGAEVTKRLLDAHVAEAERLAGLRVQLAAVDSALTAMGAKGIRPR